MHGNNTSKECLLCGLCLEVCPIFRATDREDLSPRGKGFLLAHYHEFNFGVKSTIELAELCAGCKRCLKICPQKINLPLEIARLKSIHPDWKSWIWSRIIKSRTGLLPVIKGARAFIPGSIPVLKHSLLDKPPVTALLKVGQVEQTKEKKAVIFPGCVSKLFRPKLEKKALQLLNRLGYEALPTPDWQCCGYPLGSAGLFAQEKKEIEKNLELWEAMDRPLVFVFCATCVDGLKNSFSGFDDRGSCEPFSQSIRTLIEELSELEFTPENLLESRSIVWHEPCHGLPDSGNIFQAITRNLGHELTILNKKCCGMGGSFAIQNPALSSVIAEDFWQSAPGNNILVLSDCNGCILQLDATKPDNAIVAHWLEVVRVDG